uniref:Uncharacterized protein n=1 Tax=Candidatus Methanophagaceae archaeon ANME-1 ERB6 TaxID=2759912 RepID=A0A7G9YST5_9EURY|nr:hypothetical protein HCFNICHJ_00026 [Methanosarcinales archaeon ANME-1 ERB6]
MRILLATGRKAEAMVKDAVRNSANSPSNCDVLTQRLGIAAFSTPKSLKRALLKKIKPLCAAQLLNILPYHIISLAVVRFVRLSQCLPV